MGAESLELVDAEVVTTAAIYASSTPSPTEGERRRVSEISTAEYLGILDDIRTAIARLDRVLADILDVSTVDDFRDSRKKLYARYLGALQIARNFIAEAPLAGADDEQAVNGLLVTISQDETLPWREGGKEEAAFCAETLCRSYSLVHTLAEIPVFEEEDIRKDKQLAEEWYTTAAWSQFHLDCIAAALYSRAKVPTAEVLDELLRGARLSVMAYAHARSGYALRDQYSTDESVTEADWDQSDNLRAKLATQLGMEVVSKNGYHS